MSMFSSLRSDWRETDKVLVLIEVGIILATSFMGFQFMEYHSALEDEGCEYYYEVHVPGVDDASRGEFLNRSEYEERQSSGLPGFGSGSGNFS